MAENSAAGAAALNLPPYGLVNWENAAYLARRPVPEGFRVDPTSPRPSDADAWDSWLMELALEMADFLWPIYRNNGWHGAAIRQATELTQHDLELMKQLQPKLDERIVGAISPTERHRVAWAQEDEGAPRATLAFYQGGWPAEFEADLNRAIVTGGIEVARPASQGLKRLFQRPRPQLTALLFELDGGLEVAPSKSAITPSMISGHCIQGTMALGQVHYWLGAELAKRPRERERLDQWLVDTGDRRVYAGLHYPTDNLSSWFVSLRLCRHVYGNKAPDVRSALWTAITRHSAVYDAMRRRGGLYTGLLARLDEAANPKSES